jgi:hypothetical protein
MKEDKLDEEVETKGDSATLIVKGALIVFVLIGIIVIQRAPTGKASDKNSRAPQWNLNQIDNAVAGDIIMQHDDSMRLVLGGSKPEHTLILLAPDLTRSTQQVATVKTNAKRFTLGTNVERDGQYGIFVDQLIHKEMPKFRP